MIVFFPSIQMTLDSFLKFKPFLHMSHPSPLPRMSHFEVKTSLRGRNRSGPFLGEKKIIMFKF